LNGVAILHFMIAGSIVSTQAIIMASRALIGD
jgi:hypothetical protein